MAEVPEEKRQHRRVRDTFLVRYNIKAPFAVKLQIGDKELNGVAADISEGGLGLFTAFDVPASTEVNLQFTINLDGSGRESEHRVFELTAEVRYAFAIKGASFRVGARFIDISPEERAFIGRYIESNRLRPDD